MGSNVAEVAKLTAVHEREVAAMPHYAELCFSYFYKNSEFQIGWLQLGLSVAREMTQCEEMSGK